MAQKQIFRGDFLKPEAWTIACVVWLQQRLCAATFKPFTNLRQMGIKWWGKPVVAKSTDMLLF